MGLRRDTDKDKVVRATREDLHDMAVEIADEDNAVFQSLTVHQLRIVQRWCSSAWSCGFKAGERQPCTRRHVEEKEGTDVAQPE